MSSDHRNLSALPLECFACGKKLEPVSEGMQAYGSLTFSSPGNYGSRIFDPFHGAPRLVIAICDECVTERLSRVFVQTIEKPRPNVTYTQVATVQELPE